MNSNSNDADRGASLSDVGLGADKVWEIHYHDGTASQVTRFIAHCRDCAWRRFAQQNSGCRVSVVMPAPNDQLCTGRFYDARRSKAVHKVGRI